MDNWDWKNPFGMSWPDLAILFTGFGIVVKAFNDTFMSWWTKRKEAKQLETESVINDENAKKTSAETGNTFADTSISFAQAAAQSANLYREALKDISDLKSIVRRQEIELTNLKESTDFLKDIISSKDKEYLVLKQEIADRNMLIEDQQKLINSKNSEIENNQKQIADQLNRIQESELLYNKTLTGIEILLTQMKQNEIDPLWYPTKKE